ANVSGQNNYSGSFYTGVLATLVATPCTAPFMGSALGFAITLPPIQSIIIFISLGFGMASPYLFLSYFPNLIKKLPRPGSWMKTFKEVLAFPMRSEEHTSELQSRENLVCLLLLEKKK